FAIAGGSGGGQTLDAVQDNAVAAIDASSGDIVDEAPDIPSPERVAAGGGAIWVTSSKGDGSVMRLDPESHDVEDTIEVGSGPQGIAYGAGAVWVANSLDSTVSRISPEASGVVDTITVGNSPSAIAFGERAVWVANRDDRTVSKLDPQTGDVDDTIPVDAAAAGIAVGARTVWVTDSVGNSVVRLNPRTRAVVSRVSVGSGPTAIAYGGRHVWVANNLDGTVSRIDADTGVVTGTFPVGGAPNGIAVARDAVWVTDEVGGTLVRVDPVSGEASRMTLGGRPAGVTPVGDSLWVAVQASGAAHRGGTLRILAPAVLGYNVDSVDPARAYGFLSWNLVLMTSDGLVGFKRVGGVEGNSLVPNLAAALPTPSNEGRTYTFQLRKGIRFSTGRELKASDVRHTMERLFEGGTPQPGYYEGIVGAPRCRARPKRCDLSAGVIPDDTAGTVTFHLRAPDADFLRKLALPFASIVPAGTPAAGERAVPGTGPYQIGTYRPGRTVRLVRNPHFQAWSSAAQPAGVADQIVVTVGGEPPAHLRAVAAGRADFLSLFPADRLDEVRLRYAAQLRITPAPQTFLVYLNTTRPPFDKLAARRAFAYAFDRGRFVDAQGGPDLAAPTCQVLPPNFPAYRAFCPYTLSPNERGGSWTAPDVARARKLVAASRTKGAHVDVIGTSQPGPLAAFTDEIERTLQRLGYDVSVQRFRSPRAMFDAVHRGAARAEAVPYGWTIDYPAPASFMDVVSCEFNRYSCDRRIDARIRAARARQAREPQQGNQAWELLDREIVERALVVPVANPKAIDFVSERLENYQRHPVFGLLLSQVWVR
ncbi:MAG: ABC transporter substrate-binding protein, partial [Actinomycetota bacterium]|nr:ABC transporter substrate-binding protein [Actinomycetota bacterium]